MGKTLRSIYHKLYFNFTNDPKMSSSFSFLRTILNLPDGNKDISSFNIFFQNLYLFFDGTHWFYIR
jgi:hypothetical protein